MRIRFNWLLIGASVFGVIWLLGLIFVYTFPQHAVKTAMICGPAGIIGFFLIVVDHFKNNS